MGNLQNRSVFLTVAFGNAVPHVLPDRSGEEEPATDLFRGADTVVFEQVCRVMMVELCVVSASSSTEVQLLRSRLGPAGFCCAPRALRVPWACVCVIVVCVRVRYCNVRYCSVCACALL